MAFGFLNRDAISDQNMPFFIRLYALVVPLKAIPDFRLQWLKSYRFSDQKSLKKPSLWGGTYLKLNRKVPSGKCVDLM